VFGAIPATLDVSDPRFVSWSGLIGRCVAATLLAASAFTRTDRPSPPLRPLAASTLGGLAGMAGIVALLGDALPPLAGESAGADALRAASAVMFAVAAVGFALRADATGDRLLGGLAVASSLAFFARVNFIVRPPDGLGWISLGDLFTILFFALILVFAALEIASYWRTDAANAALEERQRIARDLHDSLAQDLASVVRNLRGMEDGDPATERALRSAERALGGARRAIAALDARPQQPLAQAIADAAALVGEREGTRVELELEPRADVEPVARQALVLIASEAITNAARHGHASSVRVHLTANSPVTLSISDDGTGFDPARLSREPTGGYGIRAMHDRASAVGATLLLTSSVGQGTTVKVTL
jgi:signal transduction histidine kinase